MTVLSIRGLRKSFDGRAILRGLDLDVADGTIAAVLGPSGCGKTTLLRIIAGFEQPDLGEVTLRGVVVSGGGHNLAPERRHVSVVPQEGALFPHLDVGGNVAFGLPRGADSARRVAQCLELVGLEGFDRARPFELSGGQQQRVALARALAPRPSVVLLDEPFAALDAGLRAHVRDDVVAAIRGDGATALLVTHDQQEALSVADEVAVLLDGVIAQHGPPTSVYGAPQSVAVARFVGDAAVLRGTVSGPAARTSLGDLALREARPDGSEVDVVVRPEQLRLVARGLATEATVVSCTYYGHDGMVGLQLGDGSVVEARISGQEPPATGSQVGVAVDGSVVGFPLG